MSTYSIKKIYIDLDSLFDTRIAVLHKLNPLASDAVLKNKEYWLREHTDYALLTDNLIANEMFESAWGCRDIDILRNSMMTNIIPVLLNIIAEFQIAKRDTRVDYDIAIEVNTHPYTLNSDELDELTNILQEDILHTGIPVVFISASLDELTPKYINKQYACMFMFEFARWIKHHCQALVKCPCRGLTFVAPKLFEKDPSKLSVEKKKEEITVFKLLLLELIHIEFVDCKYFSIINPNV